MVSAETEREKLEAMHDCDTLRRDAKVHRHLALPFDTYSISLFVTCNHHTMPYLAPSSKSKARRKACSWNMNWTRSKRRTLYWTRRYTIWGTHLPTPLVPFRHPSRYGVMSHWCMAVNSVPSVEWKHKRWRHAKGRPLDCFACSHDFSSGQRHHVKPSIAVHTWWPRSCASFSKGLFAIRSSC